jgi:alpha-beta hydrolase superfamily lysophospholipase
MNTLGRVLASASGLVQFLPLSVFAAYAFGQGAPTDDRWVVAFELAAVAAVVQLAILLPRRRPTNRLILGANLYLLVGGAAAFAQQWWLLHLYSTLRESAIFLFMAGVGMVTTLATAGGFVAAEGAPRGAVRRASLALLGATLAAVAVSATFRGDRTWAAVAPMIALAVLHRALRSRVQAASAPAGEAAGSPVRLIWRLASVGLIVAAGGLVACALVGLAAEHAGLYDQTDLARVDYSGLPAPRRLTARDGTSLAARVYEGSGDVVVVAIHGSSGRGRYFHPLATHLSEKAHVTVYALDLRGHGESGGRRGDVDYIGQLEDDLADVLTAIRRDRAHARIVLLGHSAGGGLIVRYAGRAAPPDANGYVLLAPYLGPTAPAMKPDAGGWARADMPKIRELAEALRRGDTSGQEAIVLRFNQPAWLADPLQVLAYSFRMIVSLSPHQDLARDLAALRQPLLVLAGTRDESFFADRYESTIGPRAGATFTVLDGVTHLGLVVSPRTAEAVAAWLERYGNIVAAGEEP